MAIRLAGYQPARGEFEEEYDDQAECILQLLNEPIWIDQETKKMLESDSLYQELNTTIVDIFNERLQERYRRRQIVKDYGLVAFNKHQLWIKSMEVLTIISPFIRKFFLQNKLPCDLISDYFGPRNDAKVNSLFTST